MKLPLTVCLRRAMMVGWAACALSSVSTSRASDVGDGSPAGVPADLEVPPGHRAFRLGHAVGTQNYVCLPTASGFAWTFFAPEATLFDEDGSQIITHFLSPNPVEAGTPRATWQSSKDTSAVWANAIASTSDPAFVAPDSIPWLLLKVVGQAPGPTGGRKLVDTSYIHRVHTLGGIAPSSGCTQASDVGAKALVPYTADYIFYEPVRH